MNMLPAQHRDCIYSVVKGGHRLDVVAAHYRVDLTELTLWVEVYKTHGDLIFSPDAKTRFEVDLFKARYPNGKPTKGTLHALYETLRRSASALIHMLITVPLVATIVFFIVWSLSEGPSVQGVVSSLLCGAVTMALGALGGLMMFTLEGGSRAAKSKLQDLSYARARREVLNKQETVGGVSLATGEPELQGALGLSSHDAGGLVILDHEQAEVPVVAKGARTDEA